ncbi:hypothetical protein KSF78_0009481 [Schistosoma japonicum]|nr:hypothetical protein KSF78_0009481 [Schistosoma japonicum]
MHKDEIKTYYDGDELIDILRDHEDNIITFNNELNELKDVECFTKYYEGKTGSKLIKENDVAEVKQWSSCFLSLARQFKVVQQLVSLSITSYDTNVYFTYCLCILTEMEEGYPEQRCYSLATHYPEAFDALLAKVQLRDLYMYGYNYFYIAYTVIPKLYKKVNNKTKTRTTKNY